MKTRSEHMGGNMLGLFHEHHLFIETVLVMLFLLLLSLLFAESAY